MCDGRTKRNERVKERKKITSKFTLSKQTGSKATRLGRPLQTCLLFFPSFFFLIFFFKGNNFKETIWTWSGDFVVTAQQVIKSGTAPSPDPVVQVILERNKKKEPFAFRTRSEQLRTSFIARRHNTSGRPNGRRRFNPLFAALVLSWLPGCLKFLRLSSEVGNSPPSPGLQVQGRA